MCAVLKPSLVVIALVTVALHPTHQQDHDPEFMKIRNQAVQECTTENGVDPGTIDRVWAQDAFPDDEAVKCTFKCLYVKLGVIDATGDVVDDALQKMWAHSVNSTLDASIVAACKGIENTDLCDAAYNLVKCVMQVID